MKKIFCIIVFVVCLIPVTAFAQASGLELQIQELLKRVAELQQKLNVKSAESGIAGVVISSSDSVPAQNIDRALTRQMLGGFDVTVQGESLTMQNIHFTVSPKSEGITNVYLFNTYGEKIAGPAVLVEDGFVFKEAVTLQTGTHTLVVRGTLNEIFSNGVVLNTTAEVSRWKIQGAITGRVVSPSVTSVVGNSMTVMSAGLVVEAKNGIASSTVADSTRMVPFGAYTFTAKTSNEPVRVENISLKHTIESGDLFAVENCALYDESNTALMQGRSFVTPRDSNKLYTFTLSPPIVVATSTPITLTLRCDTKNDISSRVRFALVGSSRVTAYGLRSGGLVDVGIVTADSESVTIDRTRHALISHWDFNTDGVVILDSVGTNNGFLREATSTKREKGKYGNAIVFSHPQRKEYVSVPYANSMSVQNGSISFFTNVADIEEGVLFSKGDACSRQCISLLMQDDALVLQKKNGNQQTDLITAQGIATSTWHHILLQFNTSGAKLYIDGILQGSTNVSLGFNTNLHPLYIGGMPEYTSVQGLIDDMRMYSRELTGEEIRVISTGETPGIAGNRSVSVLLGTVLESLRPATSFFEGIFSLFR